LLAVPVIAAESGTDLTPTGDDGPTRVLIREVLEAAPRWTTGGCLRQGRRMAIPDFRAARANLAA